MRQHEIAPNERLRVVEAIERDEGASGKKGRRLPGFRDDWLGCLHDRHDGRIEMGEIGNLAAVRLGKHVYHAGSRGLAIVRQPPRPSIGR